MLMAGNEPMKTTMRILVVEPKRVPRITEIDNTLEAMQKIVGGRIQPVYPFEDEVALITNDEGKLLGLPFNRPLSINDEIYDIVCGTFFIIGAPADCDHFVSLTDEQVKRYSEIFAEPKMFLIADGDMIILPYNVKGEGCDNES